MVAAVHEVEVASVACPEVPDGYQPLAATSIRFEDTSGQSVASLATDTCGRFSGFIPEQAVQAVAQPAGAQPIAQPVSSLAQGSTPVVISSLPTGASYVISVLQHLGGDQLALSVTDSLTGKSVLGLTSADVSVSVAGSGVGVDGVSYGSSQTSSAASVAMVLDRSGSMGTTVTGTNKTQQQIAALAAHALLDGFRSGVDEAGVVMFGSSEKIINDTVLSALNWVTPDGQARNPYTFSTTGLTSSMPSLRPVVDLYNSRSKIYRSNRTSTLADEVHPDTGDWRVSSSSSALPSGATAFYDATSAGLSLLDGARHPRRLVVAMTDGQNNSSTKTLPIVVAEARAKGIPVYAVAVGKATDVDEADLQSLAQQTGGDYRRVEGTDLTGAFQGIQTGIRFQYLTDLASAPISGQTVVVSVSRGGLKVSRSLLIP